MVVFAASGQHLARLMQVDAHLWEERHRHAAMQLQRAPISPCFGHALAQLQQQVSYTVCQLHCCEAAAIRCHLLFADGSGGGAAGGSVTQTYVLRSLLPPTLLVR